ncbi:hypothetical protein AB5N19_08345 [Seiridium cardinale]|uniref:Uncharacterized protein n=1 Tax=Seiridium cardinale TaxID=138064 RepID=A0ABR2X7V5_9PEZI
MDTRFFRFFDLPGELRTAILEHLVIIHSEVPVYAKRETCTESPPMVLTDLLLVSHQLYREASGLFYGQNNFLVNLGTRRMYSEISSEGQLFSHDTVDARRRIRCLSLRVRRISGDFESVVVPPLMDMILNGCLKVLDVGFLTQDNTLKATAGYIQNHGSQSLCKDTEAANLVRTSPFQALLKLLADPDLEMVTLWVSLVHWSFWCSYHDSHETPERKDEEKIPIDWRRLVGDFGEGRHITKVQKPRFS